MKKAAAQERPSRETVAGSGDEIRTRQRRTRQLVRKRTQREIARLLGVSQATVYNDLQDSPSYVPRATRRTFEIPPGRITVAEAAMRHGVGRSTLARAIDGGIVRGQRHELFDCCVRTVDPDELEHDLANLPECKQEGCEKRVLAPGGYCGPHAAGAKTRGVPKTSETRGKIAASKRGRPQPWTRANVAAIHADRERHAAWGLAVANGRKYKGTTVRRWKNRLNIAKPGSDGRRPVDGRRPESERDPEWATKRLWVIAACIANPKISEPALARVSGFKRNQVRLVLAEDTGLQQKPRTLLALAALADDPEVIARLRRLSKSV